MKSLSKIFTLFKLKFLFSALLVVYLKCATTYWILVAENKVDKLAVSDFFSIYNDVCT